MKAFLWILQIGLAIHTAMGAVWKFLNPEQAALTLGALPQAAWLGLSVIELILVVCLVVPIFKKSLGHLAVIGAAGVAIEMLLFSGIHLASGSAVYAPIYYWMTVALVAGFIAYGRNTLKPIQ